MKRPPYKDLKEAGRRMYSGKRYKKLTKEEMAYYRWQLTGKAEYK